MSNHTRGQSGERGIALLITLLITTVLLGVSASLLNITLKQYQFSSIGLASEMAFQAANAGMECMLYHDYEDYPTTPTDPGKFDIGQTPQDISCFGISDGSSASNPIDSGEAQTYQFSWGASGSPEVCSITTIYKFYSDSNPPPDMSGALRRPANDPGTVCPVGSTCTVIQSRGYNVGCGQLSNPRVIERELTQRY